MLVILSGLPATGKSTLAQQVAQRLPAVHLRVDTIEQALRRAAPTGDIAGPEGYLVAYAVAADNLRLGLSVIADSVNPIPLTRDAWRAVAEAAGVRAIDVEVICSDPTEHRRRAHGRATDIEGLKLPSWADILARDYRAWDRDRLVIDTAGREVDICATELTARLVALGGSSGA